jgi:hypothetical protein
MVPPVLCGIFSFGFPTIWADVLGATMGRDILSDVADHKGLGSSSTCSSVLAPVVQDIDLIGERYPGSFQSGNSHSNTPRCHIPCCIMLRVQEEKSSMMPGSGEDEVMQIQEILIILGKENIALADGIREMLGVRDPRVPNCRWEQHDVAHPM